MAKKGKPLALNKHIIAVKHPPEFVDYYFGGVNHPLFYRSVTRPF